MNQKNQTNEYALEIANNIWAQLGGNRFGVMVGAKILTLVNSCNGDRGLSFEIGKNAGGIKNIKILYIPGSDSYDVIFYGSDGKIKERYNDVYCDRLIDLFEKETGLYATLYPRN